MPFYRSVEHLPELKALSEAQRSRAVDEVWRNRPVAVAWIRWSAFVVGPLMGLVIFWLFFWPVRSLWDTLLAMVICAACGRIGTLIGIHYQIKALRPVIAASIEPVLAKAH